VVELLQVMGDPGLLTPRDKWRVGNVRGWTSLRRAFKPLPFTPDANSRLFACTNGFPLLPPTTAR
jgi:hypothetical protein